MITLFYNNFKMIKFRCYSYLYILGTLPGLLLAFIEEKWGCIILMFLLRAQLFSFDYGRTTHHQFPNKTVHFYCQRVKTKLERTHYVLICLGYVQVIRTSTSIRLSTDALLHNQRFYHNALMICYSGLT